MPPEADTQKEPFGQIADKLKSANNVLVTVSNSPSVDQLAACIGLTIALNKLGKHATAVFSGAIPSTIEFLEPEKTIETNTDSLRDFIIALDKSKADKLRYKVEDEVVKIFITPYKTSISEDDLEFSQGDFNVDAVLALGIHQRSDLDQAIVAHGRILHDADILSINTSNQNELGSIDWTDSSASSLCEMASDVVNELGKDILDTQIATALLTGIVAETDRFSNDKASPHTMSVSGILMAAGASTQLIAAKLEAAETIVLAEDEESSDTEPNSDGTIQIDHEAPSSEMPALQDVSESEPKDDIHIDDHGTLRSTREYMTEPPISDKKEDPQDAEPKDNSASVSSGMVLEPPQLGGPVSSSDLPQDTHGSATTDPLSTPPSDAPILSRSDNKSEPQEEEKESQDSSSPTIDDTQTLSDIERSVDSAHLKQQEKQEHIEPPLPSVDEILDKVEQAANAAPYHPEPIESLNSQDVGLEISHDDDKPESETETTKPEDLGGSTASSPAPDDGNNNSKDDTKSDNPPPPVPPPMMPPTS